MKINKSSNKNNSILKRERERESLTKKISLFSSILLIFSSLILGTIYSFSGNTIGKTIDDVVYSEITGKPVSGLQYDPNQQLMTNKYDIMNSFFNANLGSNLQFLDYSSNNPIYACTSAFTADQTANIRFGNVVSPGNPCTVGLWLMNTFQRQSITGQIAFATGRTSYGARSYLKANSGTSEFAQSFQRVYTENPPNDSNFVGNSFLLNKIEKAIGIKNLASRYLIGTRNQDVSLGNYTAVRQVANEFDYFKFDNNWTNPGEFINISFNQITKNIDLKINFSSLNRANNYGYDIANFTIPNFISNINIYDKGIYDSMGKDFALVYSGDSNGVYENSILSFGVPIEQIFDNGTGFNELYVDITLPIANNTTDRFETTAMPYWYNNWQSNVINVSIPNYDGLPVLNAIIPNFKRENNSIEVSLLDINVPWANLLDNEFTLTIYKKEDDGSRGQEIDSGTITQQTQQEPLIINSIQPNLDYLFIWTYTLVGASNVDIEMKLNDLYWDNNLEIKKSNVVDGEFTDANSFYDSFDDLNIGDKFLIQDSINPKYFMSSSIAYNRLFSGAQVPSGFGISRWNDIKSAGQGFSIGNSNLAGHLEIIGSRSDGTNNFLMSENNIEESNIGFFTRNEARSRWKILTNNKGQIAIQNIGSGGVRANGYISSFADSRQTQNGSYPHANGQIDTLPSWFNVVVKTSEENSSLVENKISANLSSNSLELILDNTFDFSTLFGIAPIRLEILNLDGSTTNLTGNFTNTNRTTTITNLNNVLTFGQEYLLQVSYDVKSNFEDEVSTIVENFNFDYFYLDNTNFQLNVNDINYTNQTSTLVLKSINSNLNLSDLFASNSYYAFVQYSVGSFVSSSELVLNSKGDLETLLPIVWNNNYNFTINLGLKSKSNQFVKNNINFGYNSSLNLNLDYSDYNVFFETQTQVSYGSSSNTNSVNLDLNLDNSSNLDLIKSRVVNLELKRLGQTSIITSKNISLPTTLDGTISTIFDNLGYGQYEIFINYKVTYMLNGNTINQNIVQKILFTI